MLIEPLRPQRGRPVALIVPSWRGVRVITVDGEQSAAGPKNCYRLLASLEGHVCYVSRDLRGLIHTTGATAWVADVWRGRATTMNLLGTRTTVTSLRRSLPDVEPSEQFQYLLEVLGILADQGVRAGSLSSMAWRLWRSTLEEPFEVGFDAKVARRAFFGGRKESSRPQSYRNQVAVDISSAYPHSMVARPYGGLLREVNRATAIDPQVAGLASVHVVVPESLRFAPLAVRLGPAMIQWRWGEIDGIYTWGEIAAAREVGAEVTVQRSWAPLTEVQPFDEWWSLMRIMRATVTPGAAAMVKALTNLVWSHFAMTGDDSATITWADDLGDRVTTASNPRRPMPQANTVHWAAETASRVRVRMLLEGLYGDAEPPVHIDTDGVICSMSSYRRRKTGEGAGEWRLKTTMETVEIRAPQLYRYTCGPRCGTDHSKYHYVASGTPARYAADLFTSKHPGFQISMHGLDTVIPSGRELGAEQVTRYREADERLRRIVYGPPLEVMT